MHHEKEDNMRNSVDITRNYQIWYMLRRALLGACVSVVVEIVVFINFFDTETIRTVIGCVMAFVYGCILFTGASTLGKFDAKPYTPLNVQVWRSLVWGGTLALINIVFIVVYKINWANIPVGEELPSLVSVIINALFYFWNAPYMGFIYGNSGGYIAPLVIITMILLPTIACFLGYSAGSKNMFVLDKVNDFMFEKTDSEE